MKKLMNSNKMLLTLTVVCIGFIIALSGILVVIIIGQSDRNLDEPETNLLDTKESISGVWIASVFNIDFPSAPDLGADSLKAELDDIVKTTSDAGLNTIFFQVRPSSDALYKSELFPVSAYLSSNGVLTVDALEYLINAAHKKGIAVHAWVNPLRITADSKIKLENLPDSHPAKIHPEWTVEYADGKLYYNCGIPEVRQLVADGIKEIIDNYDVDGIVFDDYFYPYPAYETSDDGTKTLAVFNDTSAFEKYGGNESVADWRRSNVNDMVRTAYETIKASDAECLFGISPFGIWKNGSGEADGSATKGNESYNSIFCDTVAFIDGGYVDYIAPQIYWRTTDAASPYDKLCDWWADAVKNTNVRLLISHAAYRYESDWQEPAGIIKSQVQYAAQKESYRGSVFYGYEEIKLNTYNITEELKELYKK